MVYRFHGYTLDPASREVWHGAHRLALRVGIHTGLVVVGTEENGAPYGWLAVGATPNLAAKMQSLAAPETVVIGAATHHLVQGYFVCECLGEHLLPSATEPSALYQVLHMSGARGRLDVASPQHLTPFVGREAGCGVLRERVAQAQQCTLRIGKRLGETRTEL